MEKVEAYKCEICGTIHKSEQAALKCELMHNRIVKVEPKWFGFSPMPSYIEVKFWDGKIGKYKMVSEE